MTRQLSDVLAGYEDFHEFDRRELGLIEALRSLRLIHYSAWLARRWADPAFPAAFPWFQTTKYWQDQISAASGASGGDAGTAAGANIAYRNRQPAAHDLYFRGFSDQTGLPALLDAP